MRYFNRAFNVDKLEYLNYTTSICSNFCLL